MSSDKDKVQLQFEKKIQRLVQELSESANQIESLKIEIEKLRGQLTCSLRDLEELKRKLSQKNEDISCFEGKFNNIHFEFKELEKSSQRVIEGLLSKIVICQEQIQQRECALIMCKNDLKSQEAAIEEARCDFCAEVQQKEHCAVHMKEDIRQVYEELKHKADNNCCLERTIGDLKTRLHISSCQAKDAENKNACLLDKIQQIECQSNRERNQATKDLEELEKKLNQNCGELCSCQNESRKCRRCIEDQDEKIHQATFELNALSRHIQSIKQDNCCLHQQALVLENDNKEICRQMQQKVKCIKEIETALCIKNEELEQCRCCVEKLEQTVRELQDEAADEDEQEDLETQLKICREKLKKAQDELEHCKKRLEWAVNEMENMAKEIKRLSCELEDARRVLSEKISMIGDLERTIEHAEQDMENRIRRADEQLQKYEKEIKDKMKMIAECEDKSCRYEKCLSDKASEVEAIDNALCHANCEVGHLCNKVQELEELRDMLQKKTNDQRGQYSEMLQDCACTKNKMESLSMECGDNKRELSCCKRELEKYQRNLNELTMYLQEKDSAICSLSEEKSCLSSKLSNLQCRLETDTTILTQQLSDIRYRLESEVEQLRARQMEAEDLNANLTKKLSAGQRQLALLEKSYYQKVDSYNRENQNLQSKIADREDQLQAIKDTITLRDAEIMRLKLRLCNEDRCSSSNNCPNGGGCNQLDKNPVIIVPIDKTIGKKRSKSADKCEA